MESPIRKAIRIIHLSEASSREDSSHFNIAQNTTAVKSEEVAYTSPSTAENQKVSEKVQASAPEKPEERIIILRKTDEVLSSTNILPDRRVMVQKRNIMVRDEARAERLFIILATDSVWFPANREANLPRRRKKGAPG